MSDKIKVAVRVRPLTDREKKNDIKVSWKVNNPDGIYQIDNNGCPIQGNVLKFDRVFSSDNNNSDVYDELCKGIVESVCCGFHGTIFAYGQTSAGKTHTMSGCSIEKGIISLAIDDIFNKIEMALEREYLLRVSYMEIYNESITDLLSNEPNVPLKIKENLGDVYVDGLEEVIVLSPENVLEIFENAQVKRRVGETSMNDHSSRSHTIFRMIIESRSLDADEEGAIQVSHLNLVDLAGSEKAGQMGSTGLRFQEGVHINQSLFNLGIVIKNLSEGKIAVYRNSKLTRILQNSLGGNARTAIICNVTPTNEHTHSTLLFAKRAKTICNKPVVNEVLSDQATLRANQKKINEMERELELLRFGKCAVVEKELEEKDKRIENLKNMLKNLKDNVLSPKSPSMLARKMRRETWGGHMKGLINGSPTSTFSNNSRKLLRPALNEWSSPSIRPSSDRLSDLRESVEESADILFSSSSIVSYPSFPFNVTSEKRKGKRVNFYIPSELLESEFSTRKSTDGFQASSTDLLHDKDRILLNTANEEIVKLRNLLAEKDSLLSNLKIQMAKEMMSFSQVEEFVNINQNREEVKCEIEQPQASSSCFINLNNTQCSATVPNLEKPVSDNCKDVFLNRTNESLLIEIEKSSFDLLALKSELSHKDEELSRISLENNKYRTEIEHLKLSVQTLNEEINEVKSVKANFQFDEINQENLKTVNTRDSLSVNNQASQTDLLNLTMNVPILGIIEFENMKIHLSALENQLIDKNSKLTECYLENSKCKDEIKSLKTSLTLLFEENDELKRIKTEAEAKVHLSNQELLEEINLKYLNVEKQLGDAVSFKNSLEDQIRDLKISNQELESTKLESDNSQKEVAIYQVKVMDLENLVTKLKEELNIHQLKETESDKFVLNHLDALECSTEVLKDSKSMKEINENLTEITNSLNQFLHSGNSSTSADIVNKLRLVTQYLLRHLTNILQEFQAFENLKATMCDECQSHKSAISDLQIEINQLSVKLESKKHESIVSSEEIKNLEKELEKQLNETEELKKDLKSVLMEKVDSDEAIKKYDTLVTALRNHIEEYSIEVYKLKEEKSKNQQSTVEYELSVTELQCKEEQITKLKWELEEEKLKFEEFYTDKMKEQEIECEILQNLSDENHTLTVRAEELQKENEMLSQKLLTIHNGTIVQPTDDITLLKEKLHDVSEKLNLETSKGKEVKVQLSKQLKNYEILKRDLKESEERINTLKLQLRKAQNSLNESIIPSKEPKTFVVQEAATKNIPLEKNDDCVGAMGNIASYQVFVAQQQIYQLQQTCKKLCTENKELRLLFKTKLKENSSCSNDKSAFTSEKENFLTSSDNPTSVTSDTASTDNKDLNFVMPKTPKASVAGRTEPLHQRNEVRTPSSMISTPEGNEDDFTLRIDNTDCDAWEPDKPADCKTQ